MTDHDLEKIVERINALSRVVAAIAKDAKLDNDPASRVSVFDLSEIRAICTSDGASSSQTGRTAAPTAGAPRAPTDAAGLPETLQTGATIVNATIRSKYSISDDAHYLEVIYALGETRGRASWMAKSSTSLPCLKVDGGVWSTRRARWFGFKVRCRCSNPCWKRFAPRKREGRQCRTSPPPQPRASPVRRRFSNGCGSSSSAAESVSAAARQEAIGSVTAW